MRLTELIGGNVHEELKVNTLTLEEEEKTHDCIP